jgi:hypothetical protein
MKDYTIYYAKQNEAVATYPDAESTLSGCCNQRAHNHPPPASQKK